MIDSTWKAVIPLRAGSKGLPGKNVRALIGKPLYRHSVDHALDAGAAEVWLSTDIPEVLEAQHPPKVRVLHRPHDLCSDSVPMGPVLVHAIETAALRGPVVLLQATSPMRSPGDIANALESFASGRYDVVMSVTEADRSVLKWGFVDGSQFRPLARPDYCFANRQSLPAVYRPNGAVYVVDAGWFALHQSFASDRLGVVFMPAERSLDIDNAQDFERCAIALAGNKVSES